MSDSTRYNWFIWSIKPGKVKLVRDFVENKIDEVVTVICPSETKEKVLKNGEVRKREVSLYGGYIFLKYPSDFSELVYYKLKSNPFIVSFVGNCSDKDLVSVYKLDMESDAESN